MRRSSEALQRIEDDFDAFRQKVDLCRNSETCTGGDIRDAYSRLNRLRERYELERDKGNLTYSQRQELENTLEYDVFLKGLMQLRQISEHVKLKSEPVIRTVGNAPIRLDQESSAAGVFAKATVFLTQNNGAPYRCDHLEKLEEAVKRIGRALQRARH